MVAAVKLNVETCHQVFAGLRAEFVLQIRCPGASSIVRVHEQLQAEAGGILPDPSISFEAALS